MNANPYLNRQPINHPKEFFGRERDVRWLLERITHPYAPQCCSITGLRRIGKSSLLAFLAHPEGAQKQYPEYYRFGQRYLLVYSDLSLDSPGAELEAQKEVAARMTLNHMYRALYRRARGVLPGPLIESLPRSPGQEDWQETLEALEDLLDRLKGEAYRIVFLLDELDVAESWHARLAHALRALVMEHDLAYVTASLKPLFELLEEGRTSPLYNLFSTRPLGLLEPDEARKLLTEPAREQGVTWPAQLTEQLLAQIGGHPDLVKRAGSHLWDLIHTQGEQPSLDLVLEELRADAAALFNSLWEHLDQQERESVAALAGGQPLTRGIDRLPALQRRALVEETDGGPRLFGRFFADWVKQRPEASASQNAPRLDGRWLFINGEHFQLTPTEARLAQLLLDRRGRTVSREELQVAIWQEVDPGSKALDTAIQRLREKIEKDRANPRWLVTVRGEGYAFR